MNRASALMDGLLAAPEGAVTQAEWCKIQRIKHEQNRHTALLGRAALRRLLANRLNCDPLALTLRRSPTGKPILDGQSNWFFNVSHSGDCVLVALSQGEAVGVDVEQVQHRESLVALARRVMHANEFDRFNALNGLEQTSFFFQTWVLKEAYAKYDGRGIQLGLASIETLLAKPQIVSRLVSAHWVSVEPGYVAALITAKREAEVKVRCLSWPQLAQG